MNTRTKNNFNRIVMAVGYVVLAFGCLIANAEEWGDIKGSFIFDGEIPAASKINPKKTPRFAESTILSTSRWW